MHTVNMHVLLEISYLFVGNISRSGLLTSLFLLEPSSVTPSLKRDCDKLCCFDRAVESTLR